MRPEHPRPDAKREQWLNLNGQWDFEIDNACVGREKHFEKRDSLDGEILVPFCPESVLSGLGHTDFMNAVWYRGLGVFINDGGDDIYEGDQSIGGVSWSAYDEKGIENQDMNYAIFIDTAGRDKYCKGDYKAWGIGRGGYFIDAGGADEQTAPEPRANNKHYTGIFMDDPNTDGEAHFWEDAKLKYLG